MHQDRDRTPTSAIRQATGVTTAFGVWTLGPAGGVAERLQELTPLFMPSLATLLTAVEDRKGAPLTRVEVEMLVGKAVCMTTKPRDAQVMERSRGYADIEPERAFDQWQALRGR